MARNQVATPGLAVDSIIVALPDDNAMAQNVWY
jgi:hypothetical protein